VKTEIIGIQAQPSNNGRVNSGPGNGVRENNDLAASIKKDDDAAQVYSRVVERYARFFDRPEARLRFLNNTLSKQADRQDRLQRKLSRFRFLERTWFYDWVLEARCYSAILEEMRAMASSLPKERRRKLPQRVQAPFTARLLFLLHQTRHAFYGAAVISSILAALGLYAFGAWSWGRVNLILAQKYKNSGAPVSTASPPTGSMADVLAGQKSDKIWFVEREGEYEKFSNSCRISTRYETDNHLRAYYTIPRGSESNGDQPSNKIVGIVYHTPESDIVDFIPNNNRAIQQRSRGLLEYVRNNKKYNYMITRIGDIFRIVRDEHASIHAGESLWADAKNTYVLLNESFLGVCFESRFEGESLDEILTPAQITAGRLLTDVLRSKYNIEDANCTTHGLVAVDEEKMLIARHHDWVRYFPFAAMGLSDKYKIQPPHMTDYGFTYDEDVLKKIGHKLWEGAATAGEEFNRRAAATRVSPEDLRRKMRDRYISQRNKTYGLRPKPADTNNPRLPEKSFAAGESTKSGSSQSTSAAWKAAN
jgi:hypothetical protein